MSEKDTYQSLNGLVDYSRFSIEQKMGSVYQFNESGEGYKSLWDVSQPMADRPIHDIAKFTDLAFDKIKRSKPNSFISEDEIWQEAIKLHFNYICDLKNQLNSNRSDELMTEYMASIESILVMYAIDINTSNQDRGPKNLNVIKLLNSTGHQDAVNESINKFEESGLVILDRDGIYTPIHSMLIEIDEQMQSNRFLNDAIEGVKRLNQGIVKNGLMRELDSSLEYSDLTRTINIIDWNNASIESLNNIIARLIALDEKIYELNKTQCVDYINNNIFITNELLTSESIPGSALRRLYDGDGLEKPSSLKLLLEDGPINTIDDLNAYKELLDKIFSADGGPALVKKYQYPAVDRIMYPEKGQDYCTAILNNLEQSLNKDDIESVAKYNLEIDKVLSAFFGIMGFSDELRSAIVFEFQSRMHWDKDSGSINSYYNVEMIKTAISQIEDKVAIIGVNNLERLHKKFGFIHLDYYSESNLRHSINILDAYEKRPEADLDYIEDLRSKDVMVVFVDGYNDYNEAFKNIDDLYRSYDDSTLFFEISKSGSDFYRVMVMLNKLGIKPSTVVLAAHGSPGSMNFGTTQITSNSQVWQAGLTSKKVSIDQTNIKRLVSEYMQPSREIDGPYEGKMRLILDSCNGDAPFAEDIYSTAESFAKTIGSQNLEIYASMSSMSTIRSGGEITFYESSDKGDENPDPEQESSTVKLIVDFNDSPENNLEIIRKKIDGITMSMKGSLYYAK